RKERRDAGDKPLYESTLRPEDGVYPLPYMARQADGQAWEEDCTQPMASEQQARQPFYPDGSRLFEEIDRLGVGEKGIGNLISGRADIDFYRVVPSSGYTKGLAAKFRTDVGDGDIAAEVRGRDFFPYRPYHLGPAPPRPALARIANAVQRVLASGKYAGAIWTQGSPRMGGGGLLAQSPRRHNAADLRQRLAAPARATEQRRRQEHRRFRRLHRFPRVGGRVRAQPRRRRARAGPAGVRVARRAEGRRAAGRLRRHRRARWHPGRGGLGGAGRPQLPPGGGAHLPLSREPHAAARRGHGSSGGRADAGVHERR